jgi:hypothetical protein
MEAPQGYDFGFGSVLSSACQVIIKFSAHSTSSAKSNINEY